MASARQMFIDLISRDKTGPGSRSAAKNLDDVGDAAAEAAESAEHLGKESDKAEDKVHRFGKSSRTAAQHVEHLDHEIEACEHELHQLAVAFAEAETAAERLDISKSVRRTQRELRELNKQKGILAKLIPDDDVEDEGHKVGKKLGKEVTDGLKTSFKPGPVLGVAAAAAAPFIGAIISAAVIGGAGAGGVLGGVLLASKDPRVKSAGTELGKNLLGDLQKDAEPFVGPVLIAISKIETRFEAMGGKISRIFSNSSGFLGPLTDGVLDAVDKIVSGVDALVRRAGPVMKSLGGFFSEVGGGVGKALEVISGGSEDAATALTDLGRTISAVIVGIGYLVRGLTEVYGVISYLPHKWGEFERSLLGWDTQAKTANTTASVAAAIQKSLAGSVLSAGEAAGKAGQQMQTYADKMNEAAAKGRSLYDANTAVQEAFDNVTESIKANGTSLDATDKKGRANRTTLSQLAAALQTQYEKYVEVNGEGGKSARMAEANRQAFIKLAEKFHLSADEAGALATQLGLIPADKKTDFYANTHDAAARIAALKGDIASVHGKTVTVHVSVTGTERLDAAGHRIGGFRASGGPVRRGRAYVVGEHRAEVFVPDRDGTIIPSIDQARGGMGLGGGGAGLTVDFKNADSVMATALIKLFRVDTAFRAEVKSLLSN